MDASTSRGAGDTVARKGDHLRLAAGPGVAHASGNGLAEFRLRHRALPERDLSSVDLQTSLLGLRLTAPLIVSAMTGGTPEAGVINGRLTRAAAEHGIGLVLGSGRCLLEDPGLRATFLPSDAARPPLLLANLGAAQVRGNDAPERAERLVELLGADGLCIHLNPIQEAVQPEGEPHYAGVLAGIAAIVERLAPRPAIVKEVGFGLDGEDVRALAATGVASVDVAGSGGTNWAQIEGMRDPAAREVAGAFADWGRPTGAAIRTARAAVPGLSVIASGGIQDGVDVAKCLALGAVAAGMARPLLVAARADTASETIAAVVRQLRIAVWASGAARAADLGREHLQVAADGPHGRGRAP